MLSATGSYGIVWVVKRSMDEDGENEPRAANLVYFS